MGSKTRQGENSWLIKVYKGKNLKTGISEYHRETVKGDEKAAEARIAEVTADLHRGEYVSPSKLKFYEYLKNTWLPLSKTEISEGTYEEYLNVVDNHIQNHPIGKIPMSRLDLIHIDKYKIDKLNSPRLDGKKDKDGNPILLSPKTVKNHLIAIKAACVYACRLKLIKTNPAQYAEFPKVPKYKAQALDVAQANRFLEVAYYDRFFFLFILAIYYSKRKGELRGLRKQDVDLESMTASVRQSVRKSGYSSQFKDLKSADSEHVLELEPWMIPYFDRESAERAAEKLKYGPGYSDNDLIFASLNGNPVKERTLTEHYNKLLDRAGLPRIRFHDLRHTCATIMLKRGWSMKHVQTRGAWADIKTPAKTYAHITPDMQKDVNQDLNEAFNINGLTNRIQKGIQKKAK